MSSAELPPGTVQKLERPGPLREQVYGALLELITTHVLRPGRHLVESELADRLGVSRQPVREALQRLNTEGWVDLRPAHGAFVHEPTQEEADQLLSVRTLLAAEAARLAAAHFDSAGIAALEELCATGERAAADGDAGPAAETDAAFHAKVMELAGNAVLAGLAGQVDRRARWYRAPAARQSGATSWAEHRSLTAAIASGDEQRAAAIMRSHTERCRQGHHQREEG
ncbi:GntR family transcriptional regulator [Streptomyces sp. NPDC057900]|uniref:GntR family transcriptional regulator n=1 Tax=Streptomyces sp. NPDC057900 TaxID=3346274 RepID=UPI0036E4BCB6